MATLWIPITIVAAFLQNLRSLLQKKLTGELSVNGASYVRFLYAVPFAWLYFFLVSNGFNGAFSTPDFWAYCLFGGVSQIIGTSCLVRSFTKGKFAIGTTYSKTEAAQVALFGLVILGDAVNLYVVLGILVSFVGVLCLSNNSLANLLRPNQAMLLGLAAATGFALSAVGFRGASLALPEGTFFARAALTVAVSVSMQTLLMGAYLLWREPGQLARVIQARKVAVWIGLIGAVASAGWFTAMTLERAAVVRTLGQVELLFTLATSVWFFKEKIKLRELIGISLVVLGLVVMLGGAKF